VLTLSFESWEGPLDLLLNLARSQKVDLKQISILALVEQYLSVYRGSQGAEAGAGGRLSGDGGVARLSQVRAAAAQGDAGRASRPKSWHCGCTCGSSVWPRCAMRARG
jgi:hypothetical protein